MGESGDARNAISRAIQILLQRPRMCRPQKPLASFVGMSTTTLDPQASHGGIPTAPFVETVEDFVTTLEDVDRVLQQFQEAIAKYKFMQDSLQKTAANLGEKIPDITKTLQTVQFLGSRAAEDEPFVTNFELNDTLYAKASVPHTEAVYIWLGVSFRANTGSRSVFLFGDLED